MRVIRPPEDDATIRRALIRRNPFVHSSVMVRRAILEQVGGYDASFPVAQDYDLWLRLSLVTPHGQSPRAARRPAAGRGAGDRGARERAAARGGARRAGARCAAERYPPWCAVFALRPALALALPSRCAASPAGCGAVTGVRRVTSEPGVIAGRPARRLAVETVAALLGAVLVTVAEVAQEDETVRGDQQHLNLIVQKRLDPSILTRDVLYGTPAFACIRHPSSICRRPSRAGTGASSRGAPGPRVAARDPVRARAHVLFRAVTGSPLAGAFGAVSALTVRHALGGEYWGFEALVGAAAVLTWPRSCPR